MLDVGRPLCLVYCPNCSAEYKQGIARCSDCDVPLVARVEFTKAGPTAWGRFLEAPTATRSVDLDQYPMPDAHTLAIKWDDLRSRQTQYYILTAATLIYFAIGFTVFLWLGTSQTGSRVLTALGIPLFLFGFVTELRYRHFKCPRCEKADTFRTRFFRLPGNSCLVCGLRKWYEPST